MKTKKTIKELALYVAFGVLTTLVDLAVYKPIVALFHGQTAEQTALIAAIAKVCSWIAAMLFAFFTNKKWVFADGRWDAKTVLTQLGSFAAARLLTLGLSALITYFGVLWLARWPWFRGLPWLGEHVSDVVWVLQAGLTAVLNYLFSKLFIFRKKPDQEPPEQPSGLSERQEDRT